MSREIREQSLVKCVRSVGTFTYEQDVVVAEAHATLAAEAPDLVDAHAVSAEARDLATLIDI